MDNSVTIYFECDHSLCDVCHDELLKPECPLCRAPIPASDRVYAKQLNEVFHNEDSDFAVATFLNLYQEAVIEDVYTALQKLENKMDLIHMTLSDVEELARHSGGGDGQRNAISAGNNNAPQSSSMILSAPTSNSSSSKKSRTKAPSLAPKSRGVKRKLVPGNGGGESTESPAESSTTDLDLRKTSRLEPLENDGSLMSK